MGNAILSGQKMETPKTPKSMGEAGEAISDKMSSTASSVERKASGIADDFALAGSTFSTKITDGYHAAVDGLKTAGDEIGDFVQRRPLATLLSAVGVGWALGYFLTPKGRKNIFK